MRHMCPEHLCKCQSTFSLLLSIVRELCALISTAQGHIYLGNKSLGLLLRHPECYYQYYNII